MTILKDALYISSNKRIDDYIHSVHKKTRLDTSKKPKRHGAKT